LGYITLRHSSMHVHGASESTYIKTKPMKMIEYNISLMRVKVRVGVGVRVRVRV
jgi:hypothetical protein